MLVRKQQSFHLKTYGFQYFLSYSYLQIRKNQTFQKNGLG